MKNFQPGLILKLWENWALYCKGNPSFASMYPEAEAQERHRFAKHPLYLAQVDSELLGGIWIDTVQRLPVGRSALIHISIPEKHRCKGIASALLKHFEQDVRHKYVQVRCEWGSRENCDPGHFFGKHGYDVRKTSFGFEASKSLEKNAAEKLEERLRGFLGLILEKTAC